MELWCDRRMKSKGEEWNFLFRCSFVIKSFNFWEIENKSEVLWSEKAWWGWGRVNKPLPEIALTILKRWKEGKRKMMKKTSMNNNRRNHYRNWIFTYRQATSRKDEKYFFARTPLIDNTQTTSREALYFYDYCGWSARSKVSWRNSWNWTERRELWTIFMNLIFHQFNHDILDWMFRLCYFSEFISV